jgi:hypothetical protein
MRITEVDRQVTSAELDNVERFADNMFGKIGIDVEFTRHFLDRVNDERNVKPITVSELVRLFKQEYKRWGKPIARLGPDAEAVMKDMKTDINIPFALRWDPRNQELDLIAKTVMRKKDFRTPNQEFPVESKNFSTNTSVLNEGGAMPGVGAIHIDEIEPTLASLEKVLGVNLRGNTLGSVGKRQFSGDIDVALEIEKEEIRPFVEKLKSISAIKDVALSSVVMTKVEIQNFDKNKEDPDGRPRTGFVQVDFMPGDPAWLKTYYHSPHENESKYKGVFRNIFLASIIGNYDSQPSSDKIADGRPKEWLRWMWSPTNGLVKVKRTPVPNKAGTGYTKKDKNEIIQGPFKNVSDIADALNLEPKDLNSFESLLDAIKSKYSPELVKKIVSDFSQNNTIIKIGIPDEIA